MPRSPRIPVSGTSPSGGSGTSLGTLLQAAGLDRTPDEPAPARPSTAPSSDLLSRRRRLSAQVERKGRGGKTVTLLRGFQPGDDLDPLCGELKRHLGCGATVEPGVVVLQGDQRDRLRAWLAGRGVTCT